MSTRLIACDVERIPKMLRARISKAAAAKGIDPIVWARQQLERVVNKNKKSFSRV